VTDENSQPTNTQYTDANFWRPSSISYRRWAKVAYLQHCNRTLEHSGQSKIDSTRSLTTKAVHDGLGRKNVQTQLTSDPK